jgi:hypothetical protein
VSCRACACFLRGVWLVRCGPVALRHTVPPSPPPSCSRFGLLARVPAAFSSRALPPHTRNAPPLSSAVPPPKNQTAQVVIVVDTACTTQVVADVEGQVGTSFSGQSGVEPGSVVVKGSCTQVRAVQRPAPGPGARLEWLFSSLCPAIASIRRARLWSPTPFRYPRTRPNAEPASPPPRQRHAYRRRVLEGKRRRRWGGGCLKRRKLLPLEGRVPCQWCLRRRRCILPHLVGLNWWAAVWWRGGEWAHQDDARVCFLCAGGSGPSSLPPPLGWDCRPPSAGFYHR